VDAVVVLDTTLNVYKIFLVATNGYDPSSNGDGAVQLNLAQSLVAPGIVGMFQQIQCQSIVDLVAGCGLRGLGQTWGGTSVAGLKATGTGLAGSALLRLNTGVIGCDIRDLTVDAAAAASNAALFAGQQAFCSGVTFAGGTGDGLVVAGQSHTFVGCNVAAAGGRSVLFSGSDVVWTGGWWRAPGTLGPVAEWDQGAEGHVFSGIHTIATSTGSPHLRIGGKHIIFGDIYIDGVAPPASGNAAMIVVTTTGGQIAFTGCKFRLTHLAPILPSGSVIFSINGGPVLVTGCYSYREPGAASNQLFLQVASIATEIRTRFVSCDFDGLQQSSPLVDDAFIGAGSPPVAEGVSLTGGLTGTTNEGGAGVAGTRITPITAAYTLKPKDDLILVNTTGIAVTVDATHSIVGKVYRIKLVGSPGSGVLVKTPGTPQTIDGAANQTIATAYGFLDIVSDGVANWYIVAKG